MVEQKEKGAEPEQKEETRRGIWTEDYVDDMYHAKRHAAPPPAECGLLENNITPELMRSLCSFQAQCPTIFKGSKGVYDYADLALIMKLVMPTLTECGLSVAFTQDSENRCTAILFHGKSGGVLLSTLHADSVGSHFEQSAGQKRKLDPMQVVGKNLTYMRRYALMMLLGVAPDGDPDHDNDQGRPVQSSKRREGIMQKKADKLVLTVEGVVNLADATNTYLSTKDGTVEKILVRLGEKYLLPAEKEMCETILDALGFHVPKLATKGMRDAMRKAIRVEGQTDA